MGGFSLHALLPALKVRVTAVHQHGDRLYVGTASGALQVYSFEVPDASTSSDGGSPTVKLLRTHTPFKRPIDQIGVLPESKGLVLLSESIVSLYTLSETAKPTVTPVGSQARNAQCFAITSYSSYDVAKKKSQRDLKLDNPESNQSARSKVFRDLLVVGCRKKVVVFGAGKGGLKEAWDLSLPHTPRHIIFPASNYSSLPETIHLLYSPTVSVLLNIQPNSVQRLSVLELPTATLPPTIGQSTSSIVAAQTGSGSGSQDAQAGGLSIGMGGMSALSGLGGYVGLGKGAAVPVGCRTVGGEVLLAREDIGVFYSTEGNFTRTESIQWPGPPDSLAFSNPYIYSVVPLAVPPTGNTPAEKAAASSASSAIQIHLAPTMSLRQTLSLPPPSIGGLTIRSLAVVTPGTTDTKAKSEVGSCRMIFISTPTDKNLSLNEGSTIWAVDTADLGTEVDSLVKEGRVADAIGLVEAVGEGDLSPSRRLPHLRTLLAVSQFSIGQYQSAIDTFLTFNVNPALVISLYPAATISGPLHVPRDRWIELFGAVEGARLVPEPIVSQSDETEGSGAKALLKNMAHLTLGKKTSLESLRPASIAPEDEKATIASPTTMEHPAPVMSGEEDMAPRAALEALMYYLSDRRQKLTGAIATLSSPLPAESALPPLSAVPASELHNLPSQPMAEYTPEQLLRMAQIIYTGLLKVYLVARPILVGSLCRIENWCDVDEVEELLKAQKKFGDLIDLYQGKKMHKKALAMLHELAKDEEDRLDKYPPTIRYLQKLGPSELPLILDASQWVFQEDPKMALQIFTADEAEVEALPRTEVMLYLDRMDKDACIGYLEHIINSLQETGSDYHDKLAELYLDQARQAMKSGKDDAQTSSYNRLLDFLNSSTHYRPYRLLNKLAGEEMPEARAIFLGRMGKNEEALQIYVYRLQDFAAAEVFCARVYTKEPDPHGVFLLLLRIYLRPKSSSDPVLLQPALALIAKHGIRLDADSVLDLLPPLVTMEDVRSFFIRTLRDGHAKRNEHAVIKQLLGARKEEVERNLMGLQVKRVRITDQRICPQCHKRLGQSAIAVHSPRGEITHLHCKDQFSARLAKIRS